MAISKTLMRGTAVIWKYDFNARIIPQDAALGVVKYVGTDMVDIEVIDLDSDDLILVSVPHHELKVL